ncbi:MAG: hypothetical protein GY853_16465 [PVC group bacterium]|nr:hypothetical protein [PVC group bacterium]
MIDYEITEPALFIKKLEAIEKMIDEGWLQFGGRIRIVGLDPSRIAIFELIFGEEFIEIHEDDDISVPINIFDLSKIMVRLKTTETLRLVYDEETYRLKVIGKIKNRKKTFNIPAVDIATEEEPPIDKLLGMDLPALFWIEASDLKDMIADCEIYSECLDIKTGDNTIMFKADYPNADVTTEIEMEGVVEDIISSYSIRFLKIMVGCMIGSKLLIRYGAGKPMIIIDKMSEESRMLWFLAPRVVEADFPEDDDEF